MNRRTESSEEAPFQEELAQLRTDIDALIATVGRLAEAGGDEALQRAQRAASGARDRAGDAFDAALSESRRTLRSAGKTIEAHPYLGLALAAGVGLLIGTLIAKRD